jgi:hypothetical protein
LQFQINNLAGNLNSSIKHFCHHQFKKNQGWLQRNFAEIVRTVENGIGKFLSPGISLIRFDIFLIVLNKAYKKRVRIAF